MDRDQIVKSLECCIHSGTCRSCPYDEVVGCIRKREADALALIRELMAENERQKKTRYMAYPDGRLEMIPSIESVRADTVREMAERIKDAMNNVSRWSFHNDPNEYFIIGKPLIAQIAKERREGKP